MMILVSGLLFWVTLYMPICRIHPYTRSYQTERSYI